MILTDNIVRESGYCYSGRYAKDSSGYGLYWDNKFFYKKGVATDYVIEFEFYLKSLPYSTNPAHWRFINISNNGSTTMLLVWFTVGGGLNTSVTCSGTLRSVSRTYTTLNTWTKIIITLEEGVGFKSFLNNVKLERINADVVIGANQQSGFIAGLPGISGWRAMNGGIRNLRIFSGNIPLLSDADASVLYNGGKYLPKDALPAGLSALDIWCEIPFDQKNGLYALDVSGNNNHLTVDTRSSIQSDRRYNIEDTVEGAAAWKYIP